MARKSKLSSEDMKEKQRKFQNIADNLEITSAEDFLKENFLPYAWSFNLDRALTDTTGLKPVQRRILYTMYKAGLSPNANRSKVATLAGKVLEYHPHGDISVSDALKNMAREHVFRVPLIDGKGDFGVPGTPGAAGRYIEARLNQAAWINVEELAENAVAMVENYDSTTTEPSKIPVKWPVSIINGGSGMAIGFAANMPSHNPTEIMKAAKLLLKNPDASHDALQKIILGPDFNMGGLITTHDGIKQYLETGAGSFKIRGQYEVSQGPRNTSRIEFYEIPFGTHPEKIIQDINNAIDKKGHFKELASYKDLSDLKHPIRIVIETKPSTNSKKIIQDLFKYTGLETNFAANITTIVDNRPKQSSMKELLLDFIEFRKLCVANKTHHSLGKKNNRVHLIDGLLKALLDIDKAIAIIRNSESSIEASQALQKAFKIDDKQAEHILSLQLRRLTKMDSEEIENEKKTLEKDIAYLKSLLEDENVLQNHLTKEFDKTLKVIGDERKTEINSLSAEEFAENEKKIAAELKLANKNMPCFITKFTNGKIMKTLEPFGYNDTSKKISHGPIAEQIKMMTKDKIVVIGSDGIGRRVSLEHVATGTPSHAKNYGVSLPDNVSIVGIAKNEIKNKEQGLFMMTNQGTVKISKTDFPLNSDEFPVFSLNDDEIIIASQWVSESNGYIVSIASDSNLLCFSADKVRASGSKSGGVRGQKLGDGQKVVFASWLPSHAYQATNVEDAYKVITKTDHTIKQTLLLEYGTKGRGTQGMRSHPFKKNESAIKQAYVGSDVIATMNTMTDNSSPVNLPQISKKSTVGIGMELDIDLGVNIKSHGE